jgi:hypothetical protein
VNAKCRNDKVFDLTSVRSVRFGLKLYPLSSFLLSLLRAFLFNSRAVGPFLKLTFSSILNDSRWPLKTEKENKTKKTIADCNAMLAAEGLTALWW